MELSKETVVAKGQNRTTKNATPAKQKPRQDKEGVTLSDSELRNDSKPWLDENGKPLSLAQLRKVSKAWDKAVWKDYMASIDHTRREHLAADYEDLVQQHDREEALRKFFETECCDEPPEEQASSFDPNVVARALSSLPHLDREVLILHFWDGKTEQETADSLEHTKGKIHACYLRAVKRMKEIMIQDPQFAIRR